MAENNPLTLCSAKISPKRGRDPCRYCKGKNKALTAHERKFCSARHRLLFWAAGEIVKDFQGGRADGLRDIIERLRKARR
jgi:hypothetical protein